MIRKKAADAAAIIKKEAALNGEKMIKQAKDPISKRVAEEAAKKLNQEADEKAQKIIKEADVKANALDKRGPVQGG